MSVLFFNSHRDESQNCLIINLISCIKRIDDYSLMLQELSGSVNAGFIEKTLRMNTVDAFKSLLANKLSSLSTNTVDKSVYFIWVKHLNA